MRLHLSHRPAATTLRGRRGSVLAFALIAAVAVAMLTAGLLSLGRATSRRQAEAVDTQRAFYVAEAGLAEAYAGLVIGKTGAVGTPELPARLGQAYFWVVSNVAESGAIELTATAYCGRARATLSLAAEPKDQSVASLGFFSLDKLQIPAGVTATGTDSADEDGESPARIGSNGGITVVGDKKTPTVLRGDVQPGPGAVVERVGEVLITGSTDPRPMAVLLPPIEVPDEPDGPPLEHDDAIPYIVPPGTLSVSAIDVGPKGTVILQGPLKMVVGDIDIANGGSLEGSSGFRVGGVRGIWGLDPG